MKIRYDFVTNSSSTSYIIINDGEFNLKKFIDAVGVDDSSPFLDIYKKLFESFESGMELARSVYSADRFGAINFYDWVESRFSDGKALAQRVRDAEKAGKKVYYGRLSSEKEPIEGFFCTDSFIIDTEELYIDATQDGW